MINFDVQSGLGARTPTGFVRILLSTPGDAVPFFDVAIPPAQAETVALRMIAAAAAARADAAVVAMTGGESLTTEESGAVLDRFRAAYASVNPGPENGR